MRRLPGRAVAGAGGQDVLGVDHARDRVGMPVVDQEPGVLGALEGRGDLLAVGRRIDGDDVDAGRHHLGHGRVRQREHAQQHVALGGAGVVRGHHGGGRARAGVGPGRQAEQRPERRQGGGRRPPGGAGELRRHRGEQPGNRSPSTQTSPTASVSRMSPAAGERAHQATAPPAAAPASTSSARCATCRLRDKRAGAGLVGELAAERPGQVGVRLGGERQPRRPERERRGHQRRDEELQHGHHGRRQLTREPPRSAPAAATWATTCAARPRGAPGRGRAASRAPPAARAPRGPGCGGPAPRARRPRRRRTRRRPTARRIGHGEAEDVGWPVMTLVLGVEPPHRVAAEEGDRDQGAPALAAQDGLDHPAHEGGRKRQAAAVHRHVTAARRSGIPA